MTELLFYDIECFKYDSLVVFKDIDNREVGHFWSHGYDYARDGINGFQGVRELIKGKILVGYNNRWYDDKMVEYMIRGAAQKSLKFHNDKI